MTHTDSTKRHDFVILFDITDGNPNGDPDADNMPRQDFQTLQGLVSDVALKRKVRNFVAINYPERGIFIQSQVALNTLILTAQREVGGEVPKVTIHDEELIDWFESHEVEDFTFDSNELIYSGVETESTAIKELLQSNFEDTDENKDLKRKFSPLASEIAKAAKSQKKSPAERTKLQNDTRARMCENYYDIRMFGAVLSTGANAGQVRGPMQMTFARSVDPIFVQNHLLTRNGRTTNARMRTGKTEFERKMNVEYGVYCAYGFFTPQFAKDTGVSDDDLKIFWEALEHLFDFDRSAARANMTVRGVYIFTHDHRLGNAPAHSLFERVAVTRDPEVETPRAFKDYRVTVDGAEIPVSEVLAITEGITLKRLR